VETRSLYEQLQAQKEAKQFEYEEQHRLSVYFHCISAYVNSNGSL